MSATSTGVPYRPGPIGRIVRLVLGLLTLQAAIGAMILLVDGASGLPDTDDSGLVIAVVIAAWLTPPVYDIGLGTSHGYRWRLLAAGGTGAAALAGAAVGAPGTGFTIGILVWVAVTLGWLGVAFLIAAILRTPGCEMRSLPHLASLVLPGDRDFVACPGPLQPLDEWEARSTGQRRTVRPRLSATPLGRPGDRFVYLTWGNPGDDRDFSMFRRAKLMLDAVDGDTLAGTQSDPMFFGRGSP